MLSIRYLFYDFVKFTAALPGLLWYRPKRIYESDAAKKHIRGGAVVISNHQGFYDPVYLLFTFWYRRQRFICLKEFFESRWAWMFRLFLCIPIDREHFGMDSFRGIVGHLEKGEVVTMFPEGHVSPGEMATFKSGMVLMAIKGHAPIVPVYIRKKKHFYDRLVAVIGEPVDLYAMYGERPKFSQIDEMTELLREKEKRLEALANQGGQP